MSAAALGGSGAAPSDARGEAAAASGAVGADPVVFAVTDDSWVGAGIAPAPPSAAEGDALVVGTGNPAVAAPSAEVDDPALPPGEPEPAGAAAGAPAGRPGYSTLPRRPRGAGIEAGALAGAAGRPACGDDAAGAST